MAEDNAAFEGITQNTAYENGIAAEANEESKESAHENKFTECLTFLLLYN